ncbi:FAD-dependent monooxygenase [Streptomyces sp. NPDC006422]|uniref:FAD-dependent monooxygenase n=1 Tax=unclassified Streptomyces TaxID=2593676 RepID=UPI0033AF85BE
MHEKNKQRDPNRTTPTVGIVGGGVGGLAAAIALRQAGLEAVVFEQTAHFGRVGADINLTPNAVKALDGLGVGDTLRRTAARPTHRLSRNWDTGEETSRIEMGAEAQNRYGSPQLTMHRADLLAALEEALPSGTVRFGSRLTHTTEHAEGVTATFEDGTEADVDVLVGADGIHSVVRHDLFGPDHPQFTGLVAYRAVVPAGRLEVPGMDTFTKWWGPDPATQLVTFPLNRGRDLFVFATTAQESWQHESWTTPGDAAELRSHYREFHPEARAVLDACHEVLKSALYVRDPLPSWSSARRTLLGDACHPMTPFMAQGAAMAIEDAVVLARALAAADPGCPEPALKSYETTRRDRTARVQIGSRGNDWLRTSGNGDWVYAYDAWTVPLG